MARLPWLVFGAIALVACTRSGGEATSTRLPTRHTTIDPVNTKLDAAAQDTDQRRRDVDNAAK